MDDFTLDAITNGVRPRMTFTVSSGPRGDDADRSPADVIIAAAASGAEQPMQLVFPGDPPLIYVIPGRYSDLVVEGEEDGETVYSVQFNPTGPPTLIDEAPH